MLLDNCISVSDLKNNTTKYISKVSPNSIRYVFVNNQPKVVILDIKMYKKLLKDSKKNEDLYDLVELNADEVTPLMLKEKNKALRIPKKKLLNLK